MSVEYRGMGAVEAGGRQRLGEATRCRMWRSDGH